MALGVMPKCESDPELQAAVHAFIKEHALTPGGAARRLGVERSKLWRFCQTGRAHEKTKSSYRAALTREAHKNATSVAVDSAPAKRSLSEAPGLPDERELKQIKKACEGLLALVHAYEAQLRKSAA